MFLKLSVKLILTLLPDMVIPLCCVPRDATRFIDC